MALLERTYIDLPIELKSPRKGLINIKKIKIKDAFYGVMLGILIRQKSIQKELKKLIKDLLVISVMMTLSFLFKKKIFKRLKYKIIFLLLYLAMRISWSFQFIFLIKNLKIQWIHYFWLKMINRIMCTLKTLTDLCLRGRKIRIKNIL